MGYSPTLGRWMEADTADAMAANLYEAKNSAPVQFADPKGSGVGQSTTTAPTTQPTTGPTSRPKDYVDWIPWVIWRDLGDDTDWKIRRDASRRLRSDKISLEDLQRALEEATKDHGDPNAAERRERIASEIARRQNAADDLARIQSIIDAAAERARQREQGGGGPTTKP